MVFKNELYPIHFYGRVRGKCDGRLQNWPGIANERPKSLAMVVRFIYIVLLFALQLCKLIRMSANVLRIF